MRGSWCCRCHKYSCKISKDCRAKSSHRIQNSTNLPLSSGVGRLLNKVIEGTIFLAPINDIKKYHQYKNHIKSIGPEVVYKYIGIHEPMLAMVKVLWGPNLSVRTPNTLEVNIVNIPPIK